MNLHWKNSAFLAAFLLLGMTVAYAQTQGSGDNYDAERQKANRASQPGQTFGSFAVT